MGKTKPLIEQEKSSTKKLKLKSRRGLRVHHPEKTLMNEKLVSEAILQCLKDNGYRSIDGNTGHSDKKDLIALQGYLSGVA